MDPADTSGVKSRTHAEKLLEKNTAILNELQEKLYAQDRWALLLIFQGMDAAGKDSAIKHVMSGVNPQGCDVHSFKAPSPHELDHDFLWRTHTACPERGRIGIFNRSYYEEVVVTRVHPKLLEAERLPDPLVSKHIWDERYEDINAHERYLARNGTVIRKFFLHLSKAEQRRRFLARLDDPAKNWKFSLGDVTERESWPDYQEAYEAAIRGTATKRAPWYVVPADHKWYTHLIVASAIVEALDDLDLTFPEADQGKRKQLDKVRAALTTRPATGSGLEEGLHRPRGGGGLLQMRRVAGARHHLEPRVRDPSRELLGVRARDQAVVLSPEQQGRRGDAVDALLEPLVRDRPDELAGRAHGPREAGPREGARLRLGGHREHRLRGGTVRLVEDVGRHLRRAQQHPVDHRRVVPPEPDRIDEGQPLDPGRLQRRHLARHHGPEGVAGEHDVPQPELLEQLVVAEHQIPQVIHVLDRVRVARRRARMLRRVDRELLGERVEERSPGEPPRAVEEDHRRPRARRRARGWARARSRR